MSGGESSCAATAAAASLSGKMPPRKNARKNALAAAAVGGRDDISNLPDAVLQHMLSFLPAQDAVRTCVLAKRWRHLWKSTTGLRFVCDVKKEDVEFVDQRLRLRIREDTPLDMCEFRLDLYDDEFVEFLMNRIVLWIRIALQCKVRVLQLICVGNWEHIPSLDSHLFISQYLKNLELAGLDTLPNGLLDFSCCPNLEDLKIVRCNLGDLISSQSLKLLTIKSGGFSYESRLPICAPNLVSLWLEISFGRTPLLQRMPYLQTAYVKILSYDLDSLDSDDINQSIILQGLSEVQNLVLISPSTNMSVFRRDLKFCSSFNKLKSLLLDESWCKPADFSALACLLKLSPVLEKLTLQLYSTGYDFNGPKQKVEIKLSCKLLEVSAAISQHLKTLEVKCEVYDDRVHNVLSFLSKQLNIWFQFNV